MLGPENIEKYFISEKKKEHSITSTSQNVAKKKELYIQTLFLQIKRAPQNIPHLKMF